MTDNIFRDDINNLIEFLQQDPIPRLTNGPKIWEFEEKWNEWLGTKYSVMVNSGASANELTMLALSYMHGNDGEIIVPPLTWISDISSVVFSGFKPVFCDINMNNLSFVFENYNITYSYIDDDMWLLEPNYLLDDFINIINITFTT